MAYKRLSEYFVKSIVDEGFNAFTSGLPTSTSISLQSDGKILLCGGDFVNGELFSSITRLNLDGSTDKSFYNYFDNTPYFSVQQTDGKIVAGGAFTQANGVARTYLARLNSDGTLDESFNVQLDSVTATAHIQSDGKIVISGQFTEVNTVARQYIARLNSDGTLDESFDVDFSTLEIAQFTFLGVQPDNKIVAFALDLGFIGKLVRLNSDGTLDESFNVDTTDPAYGAKFQTDGKILLYGFSSFTVGGVYKDRMVRLNSDGTLDESFNVDINGNINHVTLQPDGKMFITGDFNSIENNSFQYIARLNSDGTLDESFYVYVDNPDFVPGMNPVILQSDGKIIVTGDFTQVDDFNKKYIVRLDEINDPIYRLVYTAPLDKSVVVKDILITSHANIYGSAYIILVLPENESIEDISEKHIYDNRAVNAGTFRTTGRNIVLSPGDKIYVGIPRHRGTSFNIFGAEV
jgi:uncharacterized delta-60 repeat protein